MDLTSRYPDHSMRVIDVPLDGSPEETAAGLIANALPETFLSDLDLSGTAEPPPTALFKNLITRQHYAAVEYDEMVQFVDRNRALLQDGRLLSIMQFAAKARPVEGVTPWLLSMIEQIRHVVNGQAELVTLVSDRLLYLCAALDIHIDAELLTFAEAQRILAKPESFARMRPPAIKNLFRDYTKNMESLDGPRVPYVMVITECALMTGLTTGQLVGAALLAKLPPPADVQAWLDQQERLRKRLRDADSWSPQLEQSYERAKSRFAKPNADDDF